MNKKCPAAFFLILSVLFLSIPPQSFSAERKIVLSFGPVNPVNLYEDEPEKLQKILVNPEEFARELQQGFRAGKRQKVETYKAIVDKLIEVKNGKLSPENFYKQVSELPMPKGKELRHVLMDVKKDIGNRMGNHGLIKVFGQKYETGGSKVEEDILKYRKKLVMDTIQDVVVKFAKTNPKFTLYYGEVGGWPNETGKDMKFAGDIDFNFLSGDLKSAMKLKQMFDKAIKKKFNGRTPEEIDIPCTVHGMGTDEVYVGRHGQTYAEAVTKSVKPINFGSYGDRLGIVHDKPVKFRRALRRMLLEGKASKMPLADLDTSRFPSEPGLTMEMIRHFEHDIVYKNVYTDLESFVKAGKYADRSFTAMEGDGAKVPEADKVLRQFTADLVANKKDPAKLVELIEKYYKDIKQPLPFDVKLDITPEGKTKAEIKVTEDIIKKFWGVCRKTMWKSANLKLKKLVKEYQQKVRSMDPGDMKAGKDIYEKLMQYNEIVEIQDRVLRDKHAGVHDIDPEYTKLVKQFRTTVKDYKRKIAKNGQLKFIDPKKGAAYEFVKSQLALKSAFNLRLAGATLLHAVAPGNVNDMLDYLDDTLLNRLRNGPVQDYETFLNRGVKQSWDAKVKAYLTGKPPGTWYKDHAIKLNELRVRANKWFNDRLEKNCTARKIKVVTNAVGKAAGGALGGVQKINANFSASVAASPAGQKAMKGMMLYNLKDEIPLYLEFMKNEDWDGLATEFFRRRVPFGSAVERGVMGDYYGVAWEVTATMLPPFAIASAAASVGEATASLAWDTYWSDELELFIDDLYKEAKFEALAVEEMGDDIQITQWNLLSVKYRNKEYDINKLITWEKEDAHEMANCLKMETNERERYFPMKKTRNHLFAWYQANTALRMNMRKTDPWIQLIEEMEEYEHIGKILKDYYGYQKLARWETVKVEFLEHLKEKLAKRRSADDSILKGNLPKMFKELLEVSEELDVREQIEAALDKQFGGTFGYTMQWLWDSLRSEYREFRNKTDIWDVYEKWAGAVTEYLRVYNKIMQTRDRAETGLALGYRHDQGLRLLIGPYFLDGKSKTDEKTYVKWVQYPSQARARMTQILNDIKVAAKANPVRLDLSEDAFDNKTLYLLTYHDTFKEMWKHVNSRCGVLEIPSYLGVESARQSRPHKAGESQSDQDLALKRFNHHTQGIEDLLNTFRDHYGVKREDALTEFRDIRDRVVSLSVEICTLCSSASGGQKGTGGRDKSGQDPFSNHENKIRDAVNTARRINSIEDDLKTRQGRAKVLGEIITMKAAAIDTTRSLVCELAEEMKQCETNDLRDQIYYKASAAHPDIKPAYKDSGSAFKELKDLGKFAKTKLEELSKAKKAAAKITDVPEGLKNIKNDRNSNKDESEAFLEKAKEKLVMVNDVAASSKPLYRKIKQILEPKRKTSSGQELWNEMEAIMKEINAGDKNAHACLQDSENKIKKAQPGVDKFNARYTKFSDDINLLRRLFVPDSQGNLSQKVDSAFAKAALVEMYEAKGHSDLENIAEDMVFAKACLNLIEENRRVIFSAVMPNVVGMGCQDAMNAVSSAGIKNRYSYIGKSTHPDWEYRVKSTTPPAGKDVSIKETTITINCFKDLDVAAFLATVDCRGVPKSTPQYNKNTRKAYCDCKGGLVFNPSRTLCVDCNEYYQGFASNYNAGHMKAAQAWIDESVSCPWAKQAQQQMQQGVHQQACATIAANLHAACSNNNAQLASQAWQEANRRSCPLDPNLVQWAANIVNAHNQRVQQGAQQPQQNIPGWGGSTGGGHQPKPRTHSPGTGQASKNPQGSGVSGTKTPGTTGNTGGSQGGGSKSKSPTGTSQSPCPSGVYIMGVCSD